MLFSDISVNQVEGVEILKDGYAFRFFPHYARWREQKPFLVLPPFVDRPHHGLALRQSGAHVPTGGGGGERQVSDTCAGSSAHWRTRSSQPASRLDPAQALSVKNSRCRDCHVVPAGRLCGGRLGPPRARYGSGRLHRLRAREATFQASAERLRLVDSCEFNLYQVSHALERELPDKNSSACICDIRDEIAMRHLFLRNLRKLSFTPRRSSTSPCSKNTMLSKPS